MLFIVSFVLRKAATQVSEPDLTPIRSVTMVVLDLCVFQSNAAFKLEGLNHSMIYYAIQTNVGITILILL